MTGSGKAREINDVEISSQPWIGLARAARSWNVILAGAAVEELARGGRMSANPCMMRASGFEQGCRIED